MRATGLRFELFVDDIARAAEFYQRVLGFTSEAPATTGATYLSITNGAVTIGLGLLHALPDGHHLMRAGASAARGVGVEIVIMVDDVDAWYEHARANDVPHLEPIGDRPWTARDFRLVDPDGYYIRITGP